MAPDDKVVSRDDVELNDGAAGKKIYVAVQGSVYDLTGSELWAGGSHMDRHRAGRDLTEDIEAAPHGPEMLARYKKIGRLGPASPAMEAAAKAAQPPALVRRMLAFHPHPMSVHFPIAFSVGTTAFMVLFFLFHHAPFATTAFFLMAAGAVTSPVSIKTGVVSWYFSYGHKLTPIFRGKMIASILLEVLLLAGTGLRLYRPGVFHPPLSALGWLYLGIAMGVGPLALFIGYLGGRVTFPR